MVGQSVIRVAAEKPYFSKALRVRPGRKLPTDLPAYSEPGRLRAKLTASRGGTCDGCDGGYRWAQRRAPNRYPADRSRPNMEQ